MKSDKLVDAMEFLPDEMLEQTDRIRQKRTFKWWKPLIATAACLCLIFGAMFIFAAGGAGASNDEKSMEIGDAMYYEGETVADGGVGSSAVAVPQLENQKLIRTVRMEAETETLDPLLTAMDTKITELQGYVEHREVYNGSKNSRRTRRVEMTVRVPADKLDVFLSHMQDNAHIVSTNETVENITLTYVATESRMKALQTEEERLLELMEKAANMSDLLQIEKRLTEVRAQLEQVTSQLRVYDNQVDYGTVELTVAEVREYTEVTEPETVWERIGTGLKTSFEDLGTFFTDLFVFFIVALPYLAIIAVVLTVVLIIIRRRRRKK